MAASAIVLPSAAVVILSTLLGSDQVRIESEKVTAVIKKIEQISSIPRCPGEEKHIAKMLKQWSQSNDLELYPDCAVA